MKYLIKYGEGEGPGVWADEMEQEADNIREALDKAEEVIAGEAIIYSIVQS